MSGLVRFGPEQSAVDVSVPEQRQPKSKITNIVFEYPVIYLIVLRTGELFNSHGLDVTCNLIPLYVDVL